MPSEKQIDDYITELDEYNNAVYVEKELEYAEKYHKLEEQTQGLPLEVIIELVKDLNYIYVIDPKEENDSFGQPVEISTRDITVDFEHKELVIYNECDNEEWYRFPFKKYKKTWRLRKGDLKKQKKIKDLTIKEAYELNKKHCHKYECYKCPLEDCKDVICNLFLDINGLEMPEEY